MSALAKRISKVFFGLTFLTLCGIILLLNPREAKAPTSFEGIPLGNGTKRVFQGLIKRDPERIVVASLGIDSETERLGVGSDGTLESPKDFSKIGYFDYYKNNLIFVGHYDNIDGSPAVFFRLGDSEEGDEAVISEKKIARKYVVFEVTKVFADDPDSLKKIFHDSDEEILTFITCGGVWDHDLRQYDKRIVVTAKRSLVSYDN